MRRHSKRGVSALTRQVLLGYMSFPDDAERIAHPIWCVLDPYRDDERRIPEILWDHLVRCGEVQLVRHLALDFMELEGAFVALLRHGLIDDAIAEFRDRLARAPGDLAELELPENLVRSMQFYEPLDDRVPNLIQRLTAVCYSAPTSPHKEATLACLADPTPVRHPTYATSLEVRRTRRVTRSDGLIGMRLPLTKPADFGTAGRLIELGVLTLEMDLPDEFAVIIKAGRSLDLSPEHHAILDERILGTALTSVFWNW